MTKNNFYISCLTMLIYLSFLLGYFFQENSAGGGFVDFQHISNNILLFKESNFFEINWMKYESTSLPIYYLIIKIFNIFDTFKIGLFNLIISLSSTFIFFKLLHNLIKKYNLKIYNNLLFAISSLPLLSPYFRTSTFWMLEENIGYFFMLSSIFFWTKEKTYLNIFFCVVFSSFAFYSRQSYAFICVIIFFSLIDFKEIFTKKNFFISFTYLFSLTPSLFFFFEWKGLIPPYAATDRLITFNPINLLIIFSICLFYLLPFLIIEDRLSIKDFFKKNYKFLASFFILFCLFFFNKIQLDDVYYKFKLGGGIIYKLVFHLNFLFDSFFLKKICFLVLSYSGLILIFFFAFKSHELKIFFFIFFLIFSNANIIFQEYFDPMIFFLVIIFYKIKDQKCNFLNFFYFFFCYNLTFLVSNLVYYNIILKL